MKRILGFEATHVDPHWLRIPQNCVRFIDLSQPFELPETFDLAVCLEVAEHLPPSSAPQFIHSLVKLAPIILFSAAVPSQGGVKHLNEQWPDYWRMLFQLHRFRMLDVVRRALWLNSEVEFWYRQNTFLVVREELIPAYPAFREAEAYSDDLLLIHRDIWERQLGLRSIAKNLPRSLHRAAEHFTERFHKNPRQVLPG